MSESARIWCEITCNDCSAMDGGYLRKGVIPRLRKASKGWVWDEERCVNLCPSCWKKKLEKQINGVTDEGID